MWFSLKANTMQRRTNTMADELRMAFLELLRKAELERDVDLLREESRVLAQALTELEMSQHVKVEKHQRTPERTGHRNGHRARPWETRVWDGSFFLSLPPPRR
jgi:transposase-like protein